MSECRFISDITVRLIDKMGGDYSVIAAARVSTNGEDCLQYNKPEAAEENAGLINYLIKQRHGTPFEHSCITFFVHAPIFVWREWHRHRIGHSYNEESGRYKKLEPVFYVPRPTRPMLKVDDWKPGRPKFFRTDDDSFNLSQKEENYSKYDTLCRGLIKSYELAYEVYEKNLEMGFDPGLARDCLPVGIYSSCWVTVNPRSLMAFLSLRVHEPTAKFVSYPLWEIDAPARICEQIFAEHWPITYQAFVKNGRVAP